jgi:diguanylate cyclase (GGDEF)-like protein
MSVLDMQGVGEPHNERDAQEETLLTSHRFATRLAELSGSGKVEQLIVDTLAQVARADQASLALYEEREGYMTIAATRGYLAELVSDVRAKAGEGLMGDVLTSHQPKIVPDVSEEPSVTRRRIRYRTSSCLLVPLIAAGRMLAVLNLADRSDGQPFNHSDLARLRAFVAPATLALLAGRLTKDKADLAKLVATDPLTGLFNRRHFAARLEEEIARASREGSSLTVLAVDVDLFKSVNDRFGHAAGDAVLQAVSLVIRRSIRFFDLCARMGGDEFVVVLHGTETNALQTAERLRKRVSNWQPDPSLGVPADFKITVSIGLSTLTRGAPDAPDAQELLARADRALYAAKLAGRNRLNAEF